MKNNTWHLPVLSLSSISLLALTLLPANIPPARAIEPASNAATVCADATVERLMGRWREGYLPAGPALRNCGDRAIASLAQAMADPDLKTTTRNLSGRLIGQIGSERALQILLSSLAQPNAQNAAIIGFGAVDADSSEAITFFTTAFNSNNSDSLSTIYALANIEPTSAEATDNIVRILERSWYRASDDEDTRAMITYAMGEIDPLHPASLRLLGSIVTRELFGVEGGRLEHSLLVQAVATEALEKVDRQANVRSLLTALGDSRNRFAAEFVLATPMDAPFKATLIQYLSDNDTPLPLRFGAARFIESQVSNPESADTFEQFAEPLVAIATDSTADPKLRFRATDVLTESIYFTQGAKTVVESFLPQLVQGLENETDESMIHGISNVLFAIYAKNAYQDRYGMFTSSEGDDPFVPGAVDDIEAALIGIVTRSSFYQEHWVKVSYFPGPFELEAFGKSPAGLAFGILRSINTQSNCSAVNAFCPRTEVLRAFTNAMRTQDVDLFSLWLSSSQEPFGTTVMNTADGGYSIDRTSAVRLAEERVEVGDRAAICHVDTAPETIPMCF